MGMVAAKSLDKPEETRTLGNGIAELVKVGTTLVGRATMQPGWRWSTDVKPIVGTDKCMVLHKGYCVSGSIVIQADDGTETAINGGDAYMIEPGHDAWVVGDAPWVCVDFSEQLADYAKPR